MGVARKWGCDRGLRLTQRRLNYAGSTGGFTVAGVRWKGGDREGLEIDREPAAFREVKEGLEKEDISNYTERGRIKNTTIYPTTNDKPVWCGGQKMGASSGL